MDEREHQVIGILGAGRFGIVLARLLERTGAQVLIAGSGAPERIAARVKAMVPSARAVSAAEAAQADVVFLAMPLSAHVGVDPALLAGRLVVDAMNYWLGSDGLHSVYADPARSTSERVQEHFAESRVVKAFNHIGYHELEDELLEPAAFGRIAVGVAGDDPADRQRVAGIIAAAGFDPVVIGPLAEGIRLEPGTEPFGIEVDAQTLREMVDRFWQSGRGRFVASRRVDASATAGSPEPGVGA